MLGPRIIRNYFVASACMLALASALPAFKKQRVVEACTIGEESAQELKCIVCMKERKYEGLFVCPGSGSNPHALHVSCLRRSETKDKDDKKLCPWCMKNWETQLMNIRVKVVGDLLMNCSRFKGVPESANKILRHAPGAAELKEILLKMANNFEELSQVHEQFEDICKGLLEVYAPVSLIYDGASDESTLEKTIFKMNIAFEEFKEDKIRELSLKEGYQLLVDAPQNIYTKNMIYFMSTPMFFAQMSPRQIVDLGKRLFTFARDDASFEEILAPSFTMYYICYNLDVLNTNNVFEELLGLTEGPTELGRMQYYILEGLRGYGFNVKLSPACCEKLAKMVLTNSRIEIVKKLCILCKLRFFTDSTKEMRNRVIDYWKERGIKEGDERALEILRLKDSNAKPQRNSNDKAFILLERIQEEKGYTGVLQLEFYHNMPTCLPDESFFEEISSLLLPMRAKNFIFSEILSFLPPGELGQRESIVFSKPERCSRKIYLSAEHIAYLYSGVPFGIAFNSFFAFVARVIEEREVWPLELAAIDFGLFFKKDLGNGDNAKLFFDELKKSDLHVVMPLFKKYFTRIPEYEICIANNMGSIVKNIGLTEGRNFIQQILWALCDTQNEKVHIALCKHFTKYLQELLGIGRYSLFPYMLLQRIFRESAFSENIESAQLREMTKMLATHYATKLRFGRYMDIFYTCVDARTKREANAIVIENAQSGISNDRAAAD